MRHPGAAALSVLLTIALVVGACGGAPAPSSSSPPAPSNPAGAPSSQVPGGVEAAIGALADAGIGVYRGPADAAPVRDVAGPPSPFRLLYSQVENLAREADSGGGIGADRIDELLPMPPESVPFSFVLAGYVAASATPGAEQARALMADQDLEQPSTLLFPTLVLALFVGEATAAAEAEATAAAPSGGRLTASLGGPPPIAPAGRLAAAGACGDLSAFFVSTLQQVASAIVSVVPDIPFLRSAVSWALTKGLSLGLSAAANLIERLPFIQALRSAVGTLALAVTVVAALRDWTVRVNAEPPTAHYAVGPTFSGADLVATVDDGPGDVFSPEVRACASLLGLDLARGGVAGSTATWRVVAGGEHATQAGSPTGTVDDAKRTTLRLVMTREAESAHDGARIANGRVLVRVTIRRQDVEQVRKLIEQTITGALPAPVYGALTGLFGDPLAKIAAMTDVTGQGRLVAEYHLPDEPTPAPPEPSASVLALRVHLEREGFGLAEAGTIVDLVSCDGPYGTWRGVFRGGGVRNEVGMWLAEWYDRPVEFTVGGGGGTVTVHVAPPPVTVGTIAGPQVIDDEVDVTVDGKTMTIAGMTDDGPMQVSAPIERAPTTACSG